MNLNTLHLTLLTFCGEGACSRWGAQRALKSTTTFLQKHGIFWLCGRCAAEWGQAPSPQNQVGRTYNH
ncbi:hypothetical protein ABH904_003056 [Pseudomonas frederiksbergensis]